MILKIIHISIVINVFLSSFGLLINEHICRKNGTSRSYYVKVKSCCSKTIHCHPLQHYKVIKASENSPQFTKSPCCQDKSHFEKLNLQANKFEFKSGLKKIAFEYCLFTIKKWTINFDLNISESMFQLIYHSPPICLKIYRLIQVIRC